MDPIPVAYHYIIPLEYNINTKKTRKRAKGAGNNAPDSVANAIDPGMAKLCKL